MTAHGAVHWDELTVWDLEKAKAFYGPLLGWRFEQMPMAEGEVYDVIMQGEAVIGGAMAMKSPDFDGIPSHWMTYFAVDDLDAALEKTTAAGGQVRVPAFDVPEVGRFAVIAEPTGSVCSFIQPNSASGARPPYPSLTHGHVLWHELNTWDPARANAFFETVLGWRIEERPMPDGPYYLMSAGDQPVGGGFQLNSPAFDGVPSSWLTYFSVEDVDATVEKAQAAGAAMVNGPISVPDVGRFAVMRDPAGAVCAFMRSVEADRA